MASNRYAGPFSGLFIFLFGASLGGILALLAGTDEQGETRPLFKKKIKSTKEKMVAGAEWAQKTIEELAESIPQNLRKTYMSASQAVSEKVAAAKTALEQIDREKYAKFVSEVVDNMKKAGTVAGAEAGKLKDYLMQDYGLLTTTQTVKPTRAVTKKKAKK